MGRVRLPHALARRVAGDRLDEQAPRSPGDRRCVPRRHDRLGRRSRPRAFGSAGGASRVRRVAARGLGGDDRVARHRHCDRRLGRRRKSSGSRGRRRAGVQLRRSRHRCRRGGAKRAWHGCRRSGGCPCEQRHGRGRHVLLVLPSCRSKCRPDGIALNVDTAAAIDYAVDHGAAVVNASIYGERSPAVLANAISLARAAGVLVVAAAGNEANTVPQYPAAFPEAISVATATGAGQRAPFTSYGDWVKFAAPECAPITTLGGGAGVGCATSVSTPLLAGVVALLRGHAPFATADDLERALATTARPVPGTRYGLVDAVAALARLGQPAPSLRPVIRGIPVAGDELQAFTGMWAGAGLDVAYRWERCGDVCEPIAGANDAAYVPRRATRDTASSWRSQLPRQAKLVRPGPTRSPSGPAR